MMQIDLKGKRALIAGGSRGIGLSIAKTFAAAGADVAICARSIPSLDEAAAVLRGYGHTVSAHPCDLSDEHAIKKWVEQAATDLGGVDILVNNASGFGRSDDEAGWALSLQIDVMSGVRCSAAAMPYLLDGGGSIIHIASISGLSASTRTPPYGAAKAATIHYTRTQALALAAKKIRVNCISPGSIYFDGGVWDNARQNNPSLYESIKHGIPAGRFGTPEEVANVAAFLASDLASWVTGQNISVDGAQSLA